MIHDIIDANAAIDGLKSEMGDLFERIAYLECYIDKLRYADRLSKNSETLTRYRVSKEGRQITLDSTRF